MLYVISQAAGLAQLDAIRTGEQSIDPEIVERTARALAREDGSNDLARYRRVATDPALQLKALCPSFCIHDGEEKFFDLWFCVQERMILDDEVISALNQRIRLGNDDCERLNVFLREHSGQFATILVESSD